MELQHAKLLTAIAAYDKGAAHRAQHLVKVHGFAAAIGILEGLDQETLFILETAAIVHDIGIPLSEKKYGSCDGKYQEMEGPAEAEKLLKQVGGYTPEQIQRIAWLVGHHHTYDNIQGMDYQILVEADFLVNLYEHNSPKSAVDHAREKIFKTKAGKELLDSIFCDIK